MSIENKSEGTPRRPTRRWAWFLAVPLAGLLGVSAVAAAHEGGFGGGRRGGGMGAMGEFGGFGARPMGHLLRAADATDAQKAQIKAAWEGLRPQLAALHGERAKLQDELQKALTASTVDTATVERLRKQGIALADKASTLVTQGMVASAQVLSPEQRQKVATALAEHPRRERGPGARTPAPGTGN